MEDEIEPCEEISLNKDQADCLLIVLTQHYDLAKYRIANHKPDQSIQLLLDQYEMTREEAEEKVKEFHALDISTIATIPSILAEIKEVYPMLEKRSKPESRIIKPPSWKKEI